MRNVFVVSTMLLLVACDGHEDPVDGGGPEDVGVETGPPITNLVAVQNLANVLAYTVSFRSETAGRPSLRIDCADLEAWTLEGDTVATEHEFFVMGLVQQASCTLTADLVDEDATSARTVIDVDQLPSYLPAIEVTVEDGGDTEPGWTLISLTNGSAGIDFSVALVDARGRYRWYYQVAGTGPGGDTAVRTFGTGVLIGGRGVANREVSWEGREPWVDGRAHHEVTPSYEPNRIYYLTDEAACNGQADGAAGIVEFDYVLEEEIRRWFMCDHYAPDVMRPDWSHLNTIELMGDGTLLLSSREQNSLIKIDWPAGDVVWTLGLDGEVSAPLTGDFQMDPADYFYHQHDPEVLPNGNILLFDNGHQTTRAYSRAIEIAYEYVPGGTSTAEVVWEYRHDPDIFTPIWGDADRLVGGNTLVTFGRSDALGLTHVSEVRPDGTLAWEMRLPQQWGSYRAERVTTVPRGYAVTEPRP